MRKILIISALFLTPWVASAQTSGSDTQQSGFSAAPPQEVPSVRLGFMTRPALTWLSADNPELDSKGVKPGFAFGLLVDLNLAQSANYYLSTGLMMNLADGGHLNYANVKDFTPNNQVNDLDQATTDMKLNYQYLEVPLTLKLKTNPIGYMSYFGQLGLQGGVKLSAKRTGEHESLSDPGTVKVVEKENINDDTQLFNAGLLVGLGAEYNISGNTHIVFGITYYRGFTNVLKGDVLQTNEKGEVVLEPVQDDGGNTVFVPQTGSKRNAVLSNVALNLGVIF